MSFLGSLLGSGQGSNWSPISATGVQNPTNMEQVGNAYNQAQTGLTQQQAFSNAVNAQGGLANQSNVFSQMQNLANQQAAANGTANQQALANQLMAQSQGGGPNPALAQLNQTTGQNIASQGALMAGQRGASANAGLIARQAAQQGAATQQQAVGQAASMRAQQQLAAQQQLGQLAGQQVAQQQAQQQQLAGLSTQQVGQTQQALNNLNQAQQSEQSNILGTYGQYNNAINAAAASYNQSMSPLQVQQTKNQAGLFGGLLSFLAEGGEVKAPAMADGGDFKLYPSAGQQASNAFAKASESPQIVYNNNSKPGSGGGGLLHSGISYLRSFFGSDNSMFPSSSLTQPSLGDSAFGTQAPSLGTNTNLGSLGSMSKYSDVTPDYATGAQNLNLNFDLQAPGMAGATDAATAAGSGAEAAEGATGAAEGAEAAGSAASASEGTSGLADLAELLAKGGKVPTKTMPKNKSPKDLKSGGHVPGKPKVDGKKDTLKNDTVPAMLSPGEIVLPRSVTQSSDPIGNSAKFVAAVMAKRKHS